MINGWNPLELMALNAHLRIKIVSLVKDCNDKEGQSNSDSHANMIVCGKYCWIISCSRWSVGVNAFSSMARGLTAVPIVDALIAYDCRRTHKTYLLIIRMCYMWNL